MLTRREFLRRLAVASLATATWGCGRSNDASAWISDPAPARVDVAVVGAGMSGLYAAYRLLRANRAGWTELAPQGALRVAVFEAGPRIGGRLYSIATDGIPHIPTEIGGMRVLACQKLVSRLLTEMGLGLVDFPFDGPQNLYYVRGRRFTSQDVTDSSPLVPFRLAPEERGLSPFGLISLAISKTVPNAADLTREEWLSVKQTATFQGRPLYQVSFHEMLERSLSPEAFAFIQGGLGYTTDYGNNNAAEMCQNESEFCAAAPARVVGGYQALPLRLAQAVWQLGATVSTGFPLQRVDSEDREFALTFTGGRRVRAGAVFLAMPPRALELLEGTSLPLSSTHFQADLRAVTRQAATRLFLAFREPWWTQAGPSFGFSRTDLPLRQCVYFGTEGQQAGADPANLNSLILATYNDGSATTFWADYLDHPPAGGTSTPFTSAGVSPALEAPRAMVQEATRQLQQLHGVPVPEPYWGAYIDWARDPYGAGWHFWAPGARSWDVIPRVEAPLAPQRLFVVGEAFSTNQGWVEGALTSVENVLQVQLGLSPPPGVLPVYLPADFRVGAAG